MIRWKKVPASCSCGGNEAWVFEYNGYQITWGCVCHHSPNTRGAYRLIEERRIPGEGFGDD